MEPTAIPPAAYGAATKPLQALVEMAASIIWFPRHKPGTQPARAEDTARHHLRRLSDLFPSLPSLSEASLRWVEGGLADFDALCPDLRDSWCTGDPLGGTPWGRRRGRLANDIAAEVLSTPGVLALAGPPLWPVAGSLEPSGTALLEAAVPAELRTDPRRAMLSHVQYNFNRLLEWTLIWPDGVRTSPFWSLFRLHLAGHYPIGIQGDGFVIFSRTRS